LTEYLHDNNILIRSISPESFLVDAKGYIKLTNLNKSKIIPKKGTKTYTIIGTPHYMAPEVITNTGYNNYSDIWSIGVILY